MVDLAIPIAGGFAVVLIRALKRHGEGSHRTLEDIQQNTFADIAAGGLITVGINAFGLALTGLELFHLDPTDFRIILAYSGITFALEGIKHIRKNILEPFPGKS